MCYVCDIIIHSYDSVLLITDYFLEWHGDFLLIQSWIDSLLCRLQYITLIKMLVAFCVDNVEPWAVRSWEFIKNGEPDHF